MIELDKNDHRFLKGALDKVPFNSLFARSVIENHVTGQIYVDNIHSPKSCYILHPYGMSLLLGVPSNEDFNKAFFLYVLDEDQKRNKTEWMQVYPNRWVSQLSHLSDGDSKKQSMCSKDLWDNKIEIHTRVNFQFDHKKFKENVRNPRINDVLVDIVNESVFKSMKGSVVPMNFWNNYEDFNKMGKGFGICQDGTPVCIAFTSYVHGNLWELGIETSEKYRGRGYAFKACATLIKYVLDRGMEPVWSCRLGNVGSYKLAIKLGFRPMKYLPYYELKV